MVLQYQRIIVLPRLERPPLLVRPSEKYALFLQDYSKVSNKHTVFNKSTGGDIILQKI